MPTTVPRCLHLDLSKHVMRISSRLRLCAHSLKTDATAWLEGGFRICDQCPGGDEDEHVQNEVQALLFCQDHRVCELRKYFSFLFTPFFEDFSTTRPYLLQQVNNQLVHNFLSQQSTRLFLFFSELIQPRMATICRLPKDSGNTVINANNCDTSDILHSQVPSHHVHQKCLLELKAPNWKE
jgi:hypothetical protein